jgi:hypothetical protein
MTINGVEQIEAYKRGRQSIMGTAVTRVPDRTNQAEGNNCKKYILTG